MNRNVSTRCSAGQLLEALPTLMEWAASGDDRPRTAKAVAALIGLGWSEARALHVLEAAAQVGVLRRHGQTMFALDLKPVAVPPPKPVLP